MLRPLAVFSLTSWLLVLSSTPLLAQNRYGGASGGNSRGVLDPQRYPARPAPYGSAYGQNQPGANPRAGGVYTAQADNNATRRDGSGAPADRTPLGQTQLGQTPSAPPQRQAPGQGQAGRPVQPSLRQQQPGMQQPGMPSANPQRPAPIQPPFGPLTAQQQKFVDTLLAYWEFSTRNIERYECEFQLWRYDPVFGPQDPNTPAEWSEGVIKYESPDRGFYQVQKSKLYRRPQQEGEQPTWVTRDIPGDHWVCDGKALFEFDWNRKTLIKRALPPNVQGVNIANGPLPFLLKAKAAQIKSRFWVRSLPSKRTDEYRVEAYPKRREDAANFHKLHIVLNQEYRPTGLIIYNPGFRPDRPARTTYDFNNIKLNPAPNWFGRAFIVTKPPGLDWRTVEETLPQAAGPPNPPARRQ